MKIISDGTPIGSRVIVDDVALQDVISVTWTLNGTDGYPTAIVKLASVPMEFVGESSMAFESADANPMPTSPPDRVIAWREHHD